VGFITIDYDKNHKEEKKPCFFPCSKGSKVKEKGERERRSMNFGEKAMDGRRKGNNEGGLRGKSKDKMKTHAPIDGDRFKSKNN